MSEIEINLDKENIKRNSHSERKEFVNWLSKNYRSFEGIESDITERKGNIEDILMMLAVMRIEIDTAADYSKEGELEKSGYILARAKRTKDDIYGQLMQIYQMVGDRGEILSLNLNGNLTLWRDYIMQKYDGGIRQCEFLLANPNQI